MTDKITIDADAIFDRLHSERAAELIKPSNWDRGRTRELLMIVTRGAAPAPLAI